jgi:hypothetical protein
MRRIPDILSHCHDNGRPRPIWHNSTIARLNFSARTGTRHVGCSNSYKSPSLQYANLRRILLYVDLIALFVFNFLNLLSQVIGAGSHPTIQTPHCFLTFFATLITRKITIQPPTNEKWSPEIEQPFVKVVVFPIEVHGVAHPRVGLDSLLTPANKNRDLPDDIKVSVNNYAISLKVKAEKMIIMGEFVLKVTLDLLSCPRSTFWP